MLKTIRRLAAAPVATALAVLDDQLLVLGYGRADYEAAAAAIAASPRGTHDLPAPGLLPVVTVAGQAASHGVRSLAIRWRADRRGGLAVDFVGELFALDR
jgi:hypothetical protein